MKLLRTAVFASLLAMAVAFVPSASAALVGLYRNNMESKGLLSQILKLSGERCARSGSDGAFVVFIGKQTRECSYRTPVLGRDLEIAASARLLGETPKPVQGSAYLAVDLRAGGGARYQLAAFPVQRKVQLRKVLADGSVVYLAIERNVAGIGGVDKVTDLRLRAFNVTAGEGKGNCQLGAFLGGQLVAEATDESAGDLTGGASGFSVGSTKGAKGAKASFDNVVVRLPDPF